MRYDAVNAMLLNEFLKEIAEWSSWRLKTDYRITEGERPA